MQYRKMILIKHPDNALNVHHEQFKKLVMKAEITNNVNEILRCIGLYKHFDLNVREALIVHYVSKAAFIFNSLQIRWAEIQ